MGTSGYTWAMQLLETINIALKHGHAWPMRCEKLQSDRWVPMPSSGHPWTMCAHALAWIGMDWHRLAWIGMDGH